MDIKQVSGTINAYVVLERCNFVWILNNEYLLQAHSVVLERCNFVWILNRDCQLIHVVPVLERCNFVWMLKDLLDAGFHSVRPTRGE